MNQKVIITRGISGSGKSTWSKDFTRNHRSYIRISRDEIRFMLWDGYYTEEKEKAVLIMQKAMLYGALVSGYNLVLDETYLDPNRIKDINKTLQGHADVSKDVLSVRIQDFIDVPWKQCLERNKERGLNRFVPEDFILDYYEKYVVPLLKDRGVTEWEVKAL